MRCNRLRRSRPRPPSLETCPRMGVAGGPPRHRSGAPTSHSQPVDPGPAFRLARKGLPHGRSRQSSEGPQRSGGLAKRVDGPGPTVRGERAPSEARALFRPPVDPPQPTHTCFRRAGLRPGTLPVALIAGFGTAAEGAAADVEARHARCAEVRERALAALQPLGIRIHGALRGSLPHVLNFSVEGVDSEALMVGLRDVVAVSNGSACTSQSYAPSHVLKAMGLRPEEVVGAVRMSWCHLTPVVNWKAVAARITSLR